MIVADFNVIGMPFFPLETDSPLFVDAEGVLPLTVALESFKPVARRDEKIVEFRCSLDEAELSQSCSLDVGGKFF